MKRSSGDMENIASMAKCLILLSRGAETEMGMSTIRSSSSPVLGRVFECKTCYRQFSSFQALGGHRASHKKPKLMEGELQSQGQLNSTNVKPKTHECSICGLEFSIGQALGGHMRRHRTSLSGGEVASPPCNSSSSFPLDLIPQQVPVLKRSSSRRVLCLDLNLAPPENDLDIHIGTGFQEKNTPPMIHCFI